MEELLEEGNRISVYYHRLFESYVSREYDFSREDQEIELELVEICYFMEISKNLLSDRLDTAMEQIEKMLVEEFVLFVDDKKTKVRIAGYQDHRERIEDCFYIWSLFQYVFSQSRVEGGVRRTFLWVTILLPFICECQKYNYGRQELYLLFLEQYPLDGEAGSALLGLIENVDEDGFETYFENIIRNHEMHSVRMCEFAQCDGGRKAFEEGIKLIRRLLKEENNGEVLA